MGRTPESRFYCTGDLVRQNSDGTFSFIGRSDTQIKIHGRRIELGEVEHHLSSVTDIRHSMAVCPQEGPLRGRLVAVLSLRGCSSDLNQPAVNIQRRLARL